MTYLNLRQLLPVLAALALGVAMAAPPAVGSKAPDFALESPEGKVVRLSDALSDKPVVLVLLRGYPGYQCPLCNRQAEDLIKNADALAATAARVILVYPGPASDLKKRARDFLTGKNLPAGFDLVLDPDYEFTKLYDLRWDAPQETAYPSTFIIDRKGIVLFSNISKSHGGRVKASEILSVLGRSRHADQ